MDNEGYNVATGEYVDASGAPLTLRMAVETGDPWIEEVGGQIVAQLRQVGIAVVTVPVEETMRTR